MLFALVAAPPGWIWFGGGFVLFRLFDIWKPWPVGWLDRNVSGGLGIMVDDVAAGGYAFLILNFISWWVR
jgi:phosphatidylglycerophosphatase A